MAIKILIETSNFAIARTTLNYSHMAVVWLAASADPGVQLPALAVHGDVRVHGMPMWWMWSGNGHDHAMALPAGPP